MPEIRKVLSNIAKEKGNEDLQQWVKMCEKHLYWSATTTSSGDGKVILAKFNSFLSHIVNKTLALMTKNSISVLMERFLIGDGWMQETKKKTT